MKKILIVDDDEGILEALQELFAALGYSTAVSPDGDALLTLDNKNLPDLIILDVLLSGKDGRELCKILKSNDATKNIPIIMFSAHPTARNSVFDYGADDFVAKPFEMDELLGRVERFLN